MPEQVTLDLECAGVGKAELFVKALKRRGIREARQRDRTVHVTAFAAREDEVRALHERYADRP